MTGDRMKDVERERLYDLLRDRDRELLAALATIDRIRNLEPTWHRGMYGSPDDMYSGISIHRALEARHDG